MHCSSLGQERSFIRFLSPTSNVASRLRTALRMVDLQLHTGSARGKAVGSESARETTKTHLDRSGELNVTTK